MNITRLQFQWLPQPRKPSLCFLLIAHHVQAEELARESGLPLLTAIALTVGFGSTEEVAQAALDGLNRLRGTAYSMADVEVDLYRRQER